MSQPVLIVVKRWKCPHCSRSRSRQSATAEHITRCWFNPDNQTCKTCVNFQPAISGGCYGDPQCNCPDQPQQCFAGIELPEVGGDMVTGCPKWRSRDEELPDDAIPYPLGERS